MPRDRPVRVLVDALNLKPGQGGIRTYTREVVRRLASDPRLEITILTSAPNELEVSPAARIISAPAALRRAAARAMWREAALHGIAGRCRSEVLFFPVPEVPWRRQRIPTVAVVHDAGPLAEPRYFSRAKRIRCRYGLVATTRRAAVVVAVSEATAGVLRAERLITDLAVVPEGSTFARAPEASPDAAKPYLLYVGSLYAHKNVRSVVGAFAGAGADKLLLVGPTDGGGADRLREWRAEFGVNGRVEHVGFVARDALARLYAGARAVVCPSLHEGFGLPALEAQALGCPVIASDIPVVREVVGDAALLVADAQDPGAWREAIDRILADDVLCADLSARGRVQARKFSWERCSAALGDLIVAAAEES